MRRGGKPAMSCVSGENGSDGSAFPRYRAMSSRACSFVNKTSAASRDSQLSPDSDKSVMGDSNTTPFGQALNSLPAAQSSSPTKSQPPAQSPAITTSPNPRSNKP